MIYIKYLAKFVTQQPITLIMGLDELIKLYREKNGLSQQAVANFLGIQREALSYFENGQRQPPLEVLEKLANLYGADLADFFEKDEQVAKTNIAFAFRSEAIVEEDLVHLSTFRKAVKNYFKICSLEKNNGY